ncbi:MAG: DUF1045 domain-containing protein [Pararhodobacter sp.]
MEQFHFHLTLTDHLPEADRAPVMAALSAHLSPVLPRPFVIGDLCLVAEDAGGRFHLRHRAALAGGSAASSRAAPSSGVPSLTTVAWAIPGGI